MTTVAITGLNAGDSPAPGVAVVRCLREHPEWSGRIVAFAYDAFESGILDKTVADSAYLIPYPTAGKEALYERIIAIHKKERLDVIIPNLDSELPNFIALQEKLLAQGIRLFIPTEEQFHGRSKANLPRFAKQAGVRVPDTILVHGTTDEQLRQLRYPVMVKGVFYEAHLAQTSEEASHYIQKIAHTWGYPVLIQRYIKGEEYNAVALGDGAGGVVGCAFMKKLVLTDKRKGWACVSIENAKLMELTHRIVLQLSWKGPIEIEAIYSEEEDCFFLIELNPRFPAWVYLAKSAGVNLPHACLKMALGETFSEKLSHRSGVIFSNYTVNLVAELSAIGSLFTEGELHYEKVV